MWHMFLIFLRLESCVNLKNISEWYRIDLSFGVLTTRIMRFSCKFLKIIFSTKHHRKLGFSSSFTRWPGRVVFEQKLRKINAHQDQKHLSNKQPICKIQMWSDITFQSFTLFNPTHFWMFLRLESCDFNVNFNNK